MENEDINNNISSSKIKEYIKQQNNNTVPKFNFYNNKNLNNNKILTKKIYFNTDSNHEINNNKKINMNYDEINDDDNMNNLNMNEKEENYESTLGSNIYERNIALLNDKIKEQENDINYLKNRLQNYDNTMEEMTNLNIMGSVFFMTNKELILLIITQHVETSMQAKF